MRCSSCLIVPRRTELRGVNQQSHWLTALLRKRPPVRPGRPAQTLGVTVVQGPMGWGLHRCHAGDEELLWKAPSPLAPAASPNSMTGTAKRWRKWECSGCRASELIEIGYLFFHSFIIPSWSFCDPTDERQNWDLFSTLQSYHRYKKTNRLLDWFHILAGTGESIFLKH